MRRTTALRTALSAVLLVGAWAGAGFPSAQAADAPVTGARTASDTRQASAGLLAAMQKDLGLTEGQARARLSAEKSATAIQPAARRAAGASYGGSWFDPSTGGLTVAVTSEKQAAAVRATGAAVRLVAHTARSLDAAKARIDRLRAPAGVSSWHVDPEASKVVVNVVSSARSDNDVQQFVERARDSRPRHRRALRRGPEDVLRRDRRGDPYYTGNVRCSIGFSVYGGFVTAGHCGQAGASVSGWDGSGIGSFQGSSFPDNDYAWVSVGNGWWTVPVVLGWGAVSDQLVRGSAVAPVGASICRSGSTSHWHCGSVLATNETVNYSQGAVHQMTKTSVCAEPGDSGGSFISGDQAQGVTSGGWGNCSSGGETWHQPINEILNRYGLTLHTA